MSRSEILKAVSEVDVKIDAILHEEAEIMTRCRLYDYDNNLAMFAASEEIKAQRVLDLQRMQFLFSQLQAIEWCMLELKAQLTLRSSPNAAKAQTD